MPAFRGEKYFLSNMFPCPFMVGTTVYKSSEHFYHAHLTSNFEDFNRILNESDGFAAKRLARTLPRCINQKEIKVLVMAEAIMFKFLAHPNLVAKLIATPDEELIEYNEHHDNYWGSCTCERCKNKDKFNRLGALLRCTKDYFRTIHSL